MAIAISANTVLPQPIPSFWNNGGPANGYGRIWVLARDTGFK
jgi:hypothetical protein